jgi:hypothetical protein
MGGRLNHHISSPKAEPYCERLPSHRRRANRNYQRLRVVDRLLAKAGATGKKRKSGEHARTRRPILVSMFLVSLGPPPYWPTMKCGNYLAELMGVECRAFRRFGHGQRPETPHIAECRSPRNAPQRATTARLTDFLTERGGFIARRGGGRGNKREHRHCEG